MDTPVPERNPKEETMTTANNLQPLLPAVSRFAIAAAVAAVLSVVWVGAESASHGAVDTTAAAMSATNVRFVKLPDVEIVGRRSAKQPTA
jgi:hypothetical protein